MREKFDFYDQTYLKTYNLDESIRYQLNLLDSLDVYTRKHSENVATITCNLCHKLHLSKDFTEYCTICAFLHDIGKLYIPSSILQKPSALTEEEYEIMKKHTTLGYNLCIKDPKLRPYYAGPYYHHESLDGTGYPQGLTRKDIPYEAQIIRVADEFDALVNKRQYKSHIGISDSLKMIANDTKPSPNAPKKTGYTRAGKVNKDVVRKLFKVVIDDIEYEVSYTDDYIYGLKQDIKRLKKAQNYIKKFHSSSNAKKAEYYRQYALIYLKRNETIENFDTFFQETKDMYIKKCEDIKSLRKEIKTIKRIIV